MKHGSQWIYGQWSLGQGGPLTSHDPATGSVIWEGHEASPSQIHRAVDGARMAFNVWSIRPIKERQRYLERFVTLLETEREEMARRISLETGKPLWEASKEVSSMIGKYAISLQAYHERTGQHESVTKGIRSMVRHVPHGALAVLGPYNFPGHLPNGHILPALLAGNTIVLKPSEQTPLVAELYAELWERAELPEGVVNLLQGGPTVGQSLALHPDLDGLLFTGSAETAQALTAAYGARPGKILAIEGGGNNPLVVGEIDNIEAAVLQTIRSAYLTAGQRCTCARRLIVLNQEAAFLEALQDKLPKIRVGRFDEQPEPFMGPVISPAHAKRLLAKQETLIQHGAEPLIPMRHLDEQTGLLTPGLIDVTSLQNREDEELFGPLLQLIRVDSFEQALYEANQTRYGLAAALFSTNAEWWERFVCHVKAGIINWNSPTTGALSSAPFGGVGVSGNYRPSAYYAADYCAYPIASIEQEILTTPATPGVE